MKDVKDETDGRRRRLSKKEEKEEDSKEESKEEMIIGIWQRRNHEWCNVEGATTNDAT